MKILMAILALGFIMQIPVGAIEIPEPFYCVVTPNEGSIYLTEPATDYNFTSEYIYIYHVDTGRLKELSKSQDPLFLEIYNPEIDKWINTGLNTSKNGSRDAALTGVINFKVDLAKIGTPFLGQSRFRFVDSKGNVLRDMINGELLEFPGPRIIANLKNESYKIENDGLYSYSVWVRSEDTITINLYGLQSDGNTWDRFPSPLKSSSKGWKKLEWKNAPYYKVVEFNITES